MLGNGSDGVESPLADKSILLIGELLLQQLDNPGRVLVLKIPMWRIMHFWTWWDSGLLCGGILLLDIAVDEGGDVSCGSVDLVLGLGDVQLAEQLLENFDRLCVFRLYVCGGRHVCGGFGE